jgi:hypothetical protein
MKNSNRLVLGEREAVIQEIRANGGVYIDPHPEALRTLQAGNIDPYLIYEQGMLKQIEVKIPRIDFVKVNVDDLFEEWQLKPEAQALIHVRLIIWLKMKVALLQLSKRFFRQQFIVPELLKST